MSYPFDSRLGEQLYRLLPEVYRSRDKAARPGGTGSGAQDLARYLDAHGHLLDMIHATLEQQLKDALPGSSQDWLLPYFAQLLAANIVSPDADGRHAEIDHAVSWRQRKGTLKCAEAIAEAVGQMEVEIQEGWKRVAMTPRIGMPVMPSTVWDDTLELDMTIPSEAVRHPTLPAVMADLRRSSRAVEASPANPASRNSNFGGVRQAWRQANFHGVACFPDSFDDVSRRTVDLRTPDATKGYYHHKRLLVFAPPPTGLFGLEPIVLKWRDRGDSRYAHLIEEKEENGVWVVRNMTDRVIHITGNVTLSTDKPKPYRIEGLNFGATLSVDDGSRLALERVEAMKVQVDTVSTNEPVLTAAHCLFNELSVGNGTARLDSCTVLEKAHLSDIDVVDCIFMDMRGKSISGMVKYSRIPENAPLSTDMNNLAIKSHHQDDTLPVDDDPRFISGQPTLAGRAVLSPYAPGSIYQGASDHGEMGYYHRGRKKRPVHVKNDISFSLPADGGYPLADIIFEKGVRVTTGQLVLVRSVVKSLIVTTAPSTNKKDVGVPVLVAKDCLFDSLTVGKGLARLEYCTVMGKADCKYLQASDCIFAGLIVNVKMPATNKARPAFFNCLRYSSIPSGFLEAIEDKLETSADKKLARALQLIDEHGRLTLRTNTLERPLFDEFSYCRMQNGSQQVERRGAKYGEWGFGVLSLLTPPAVRFGAEDGGEMGACHHKQYSLKAEAVLHKMKEFLPVGIEPVLTRDTRLIRVPPKQLTKNATDNGVHP